MSGNDSLGHVKANGDHLVRQAEILSKHPEGEAAFVAWCDNFDFDYVFSTRWKDVDDEIAYCMVMMKCYFGIFEEDCGEPRFVGKLYIEADYSTYIWWDGEWKLEDDLTDELEAGTEKV